MFRYFSRSKALFFLILMVFGCTTKVPQAPKPVTTTIQIYLVKNNNVAPYYYRGKDVDLIILFSDTLTLKAGETFNIHTLSASILPTEDMIFNRVRDSLVVPLFWKSSSSLPVDSSNMYRYDSIFVTSGLSESNVLKSYVLNLPPIVWGLDVGDSSYLVPTHITDPITYEYYLSDSTDSVIPLLLTITDPDNTYDLNWKLVVDNPLIDPDKYLSWVSNSAKATYIPRSGNLRDIATALINDGDKQIQISVKFIRTDGLDLKIDSIAFADTTYLGAENYIYKSIIIDTVDIVVYPHSSSSSISFAANNGLFTVDAGAIDPKATYVCTLSVAQDTLLKDTLAFLDTIKVTLKNSLGDDSTVNKIFLYKRPLNSTPQIDSIVGGSTSVKDTNQSYIKFTISQQEILPVKAFAHDPDGASATISYSWIVSKIGTLAPLSGDSVLYSPVDSMYSDTFTVIVADSLDFEDSAKIIVDVRSEPKLDSLRVKDSTVVPQSESDTVFSYVGSALDTFSLKSFASDYDTKFGDLLSYTWSYKDENLKNTVSLLDSIVYISADSAYTDTVKLKIKDLSMDSLSYKIILNILK